MDDISIYRSRSPTEILSAINSLSNHVRINAFLNNYEHDYLKHELH